MEGRRRGKKRWTFKRKFTYGLIAGLFLISCVILFSYLNTRSQPDLNGTSGLKAAIVDHLSDSHPNQTFVGRTKSILTEAGFSVYYYSKAAVDVNFYRNLPSRGFDLIILRVHSAVNEQSDLLVLFTAEPFSDSKARNTYFLDFMHDPPRLVRAMLYEGSEAFFGITPSFVDSMNGDFDDALIMIMGCNGLDPSYTSMAEALIEKGAKVCTGWNELVSSSHTDYATTLLMQKLFVEEKTIKTSVEETNSEAGPDPVYESKLVWYPPERGDISFGDLKSESEQLADYQAVHAKHIKDDKLFNKLIMYDCKAY